MSVVVPLSQENRRPPEAGRIRLGVKTGRAMKAIDTLRFTSPHRRAIEQLAAMYGGSVEPWDDPRARTRNQFQVITKAKTIEVYLPMGGLSQWYEKWSGGGVERRCDGEQCEVPGREDIELVPCVCNRKGVRECRPYTRMNLVLPGVDFYGTWRLETKGENAMVELPGMYDMIAQLSSSGRMVKALLSLEQRTSVRNGQTKHYVVPTLAAAATPEQMLQGGGTAQAQLGGGEVRELNVAPQVEPEHTPVELVSADEPLRVQVREACADFSDGADAVLAKVWEDTGGDEESIDRFLANVERGRVIDLKDGQWVTA